MYSFPNLETVHCSMSGSNSCFLTCIQVSQEAGKVLGIPISKNFPQFSVIHPVKGFSIVNEADVFLEFFCFFSYVLKDVGNLISFSLAFSQSSLDIWKFLFQVLLKPGLENFQHYFGSVRHYPITIVISNQVPSYISLDLLYLIVKMDINYLV